MKKYCCDHCSLEFNYSPIRSGEYPGQCFCCEDCFFDHRNEQWETQAYSFEHSYNSSDYCD